MRALCLLLAAAAILGRAAAYSEYTIASTAHGNCTTIAARCVAANQTYVVGSDPACQGYPSLSSSGQQSFVSLCLLPAGPGTWSQAFSAMDGLVSTETSMKVYPLPLSEYTVYFGSGVSCSTTGGSCSAGLTSVSIATGQAGCGVYPQVSWSMFAWASACLPASGTSYYQSLNVFGTTAPDSVTVTALIPRHYKY